MEAEATRKDIIHLLAVEPLSEEDLRDKLPDPNSNHLLGNLKSVAMRDDSGLWRLLSEWWKLDVWEYDYDWEEDRQRAIRNAVIAYDDMRLAITEPEWERLLSPDERGTGKCLSKFAVTENAIDEQLSEPSETSSSPSSWALPPPPPPEPNQENQLFPQTSSYWSLPEQTDFPALLAHFGTDWHGIAKWMRSKTHIMVKNFYQRRVDSGSIEWEQVAKATDALIEKGLPTGPLPTPTVIPKRRYDVSPTGLSRSDPGGESGEQTDVGFQDTSLSVHKSTSQSDPTLHRLSVSELFSFSGNDTRSLPQDYLNHEAGPKDAVLLPVSTMISKGPGTTLDVVKDRFDFVQANTSSAATGFSPNLAANGTRDISRSASVIAMAATAASSRETEVNRHESVVKTCDDCRSGLLEKKQLAGLDMKALDWLLTNWAHGTVA
ncbi:hypothetical protein IFR05_010712 [Cadophora sp. M221]|nr:hypothetical protein IFR05_010712 [Cadophora sp. M221]